MPRSATYSSVTKFDSNGDGIFDTSAPGTRTQEFDDQGNLVHDRSTTDLNGDSTLDFVDESRFSYDTNNNVVTQVVTERQVAENSSQAKLMAVARDSVYTNAYNGQSTLIVDTDADGHGDKLFTAQNTYDQNNRLVTSVVEADNNGDGKIDYRELVTNDYDAQGKLVGEHQEIRDSNNVVDFLYTATHTYNTQGELISSEFNYDLNGDGINDIQISQNAVADNPVTPPLVVTPPVTPPPPPDKLIVPDYFGLLDRDQNGDNKITFADLDNGDINPAGKDDGVIDSYDRPLYDPEALNNLNDLLSATTVDDINVIKPRATKPSETQDRRADLENLKELLKSHPTPYPEHKDQPEKPPVTETQPEKPPVTPPSPPPSEDKNPPPPGQSTDLIHEHTVLFDHHAAHADMFFM